MANYFEKFSALYYPSENGKYRLLIDITKRAIIKSDIINNIDTYIEYNVKDGDSLQNISYKLYGSVEPFWVLLLINQQLNPYKSLPLTENILKEQAKLKYGENNLDNIHHYINTDDVIVDSPTKYDEILNKWYIEIDGIKIYKQGLTETFGISPITNWQYELQENESTRKIKLLKPEYLDNIIEEFNQAVA